MSSDGAYSLSGEAKNFASALKSSATLRFYASKSSPRMPESMKKYAERVEWLLRDLCAASRGKLTLHVLDPEPDSEDEEAAFLEGLKPFQLNTGDRFYLGLSVSNADRCIAVDEFGRVVNGDLILYVCGLEMKQKGELLNNTIVTTVMSNFGLYKSLDKAGIQYEKTAVGDKYVYENMMKNGHCIGGEQSGHIIFSKHATTGDGILTSLKIMETMVENKKTLAQLTEQVEIYPQLLINVRVSDKALAQNDPDVQKAVKEVEEALGDEGRILVRESGTEPVVRVMVEAQSDEICHEYVLKVVNTIKAKGYAVEK